MAAGKVKKSLSCRSSFFSEELMNMFPTVSGICIHFEKVMEGLLLTFCYDIFTLAINKMRFFQSPSVVELNSNLLE